MEVFFQSQLEGWILNDIRLGFKRGLLFGEDILLKELGALILIIYERWSEKATPT